MLGVFSTREIATMFWSIFIIIIIILKGNIRDSVKGILKTMLTPKLVIPFSLLIFYIIMIAYLFSLNQFWKTVYLKEVIISTIFIVIPMAFSSITQKDIDTFIKQKVFSSIKLIVLVEFIINTFTFNIFVELVIIPIILIIGIIDVFSELNSEYSSLQKLSSAMLTIIGFLIFGFSLNKAINSINTIEFTELIITFSIPITLTILTVPFAFAFSLYAIYETTFLRMSSKEPNNKKIKLIHRLKIIKKCKLSHKKISKFKYNNAHKMYISMSEQEFDSLIHEL